MHGPCRRQFATQCATNARRQERTTSQPKQYKTRADRAQAKNVLQPKWDGKQDAEFTHGNNQRRNRTVSKRRDSEQVQIQKHVLLGLLTLVFPEHEQHGCDQRDCQGNRDGR